MKLLAHKKISFVDEMQLLFKAQGGSYNDYVGLKDILTEMDKIQNELGFEEGKQPPKQKPTITIAQERIEQYVKTLFNLAIHYDLDKKKATPFSFKWRGYISSSFYKNQNFYFEIGCMFYNYSVLYFNQGLELMNSQGAEKQANLKTALRYFRMSMWGFNETTVAITKCLTSGTVPQELNGNNMAACYHVSAAMAYKCLYEALKPSFGQFTKEQAKSFHKTAYVEFTKAFNFLEKASEYQFDNLKQLRSILNAYKVFHLSQILLTNSKEYEVKHKEDITGGFIGVRIAFIENLQDYINELKDAEKLLKTEEVTKLYEDVVREVKLLNELQLENKEVYKAKVPKRDELPPIPESEHKITRLDQPHVKKPIDKIQTICTGKYSAQYRQLVSEFALIINNNKNNLNAMIENIEKLKIDEYKKHNLDIILRIALSSQDYTLENKIKEIKDIHGGLKGYSNLVTDLQSFFAKNDSKASHIKKLIEEDHISDAKFYNSYGVKVLGIKESGSSILTNFERHGVTLTGLKNKDKQLLNEFNNSQELLKQIDDDKILPQLSQIQSNIKNSEDIQNLIKKNQLLTDIFKLHIEPKKKLLYDYLKQLDVKALVYDIFFNLKTQEKVYEELNKNLCDKVEEFRNMITQIQKALEKIGEVALRINMEISKNSNNLNFQQKIISDVNNVHILYQSLLNNLELHDNLLRGAETLEQLMTDYLISKEAQKQEMMQNINAYRGMNVNEFITGLMDHRGNGKFYNGGGPTF